VLACNPGHLFCNPMLRESRLDAASLSCFWENRPSVTAEQYVLGPSCLMSAPRNVRHLDERKAELWGWLYYGLAIPSAGFAAAASISLIAEYSKTLAATLSGQAADSRRAPDRREDARRGC
jgi:hypothetical protein